MPEQELFWSLILEPNWIQASIWSIEEGKAVILSTSPISHWEEIQDLTTSADTCLSAAVQNLEEGLTEPSKTVFGVPSSWVTGGQIKNEYLILIKNMCSKLSLDPAGFVVIPEAIAFYFKSKEGTALNSVVIGLSEQQIEISIFKLGNLSGTTSITRSVSIVDDVVEGLARLSVTNEPLPSRFLIYNGKEGELEEARQALTDSDWETVKEIPKFFHTPKIEVIDPDIKMSAVCLAGGSEIGGVKGVTFWEESSESGAAGNGSVGKIGPTEVGFAVGRDIKEENLSLIDSEKKVKVNFINKWFDSFTDLKTKLNKFYMKTFLPNFPKFSFGYTTKRFNFSLWGLILVAIFLLGFFWWWFFPKVEITVFVAPKKIEDRQNISIVIAGSNDINNGKINGKLLNVKEEGEKTKETTGIKKVGEKAKGSVKIRNGTSLNINLPSSTIILGPESLKFSLDLGASVSGALSPSDPGTAIVNVTAFDIGAEYNLAKNEIFRVGNFSKSDVDAISDSNFTGGSSREIPSVSEEDRSFLEKSLSDELRDKANQEIKKGINSDEVYIGELVDISSKSKDFSNKTGDEATTLKLKMTIDAKSISVSKNDLTLLAKKYIGNKIPTGYILKEDEINFSFTKITNDQQNFSGEIDLIANLIPQIKTSSLASQIAGKYIEDGERYLAKIPGFVRAEIKLQPKLPKIISSFPRMSKNIKISIVSEK